MKSKTKKCQNCNESFTIDASDFEFYKKIDVPEPTFCPDCRLQRRLAWRNEENLYRIKCAHSGEEIFSYFYPETNYTVYEKEFWWTDKWDPMEYGRDYDFEKNFFEQLKELFFKVPIPSRSVQKLVNSDYSSDAGYLKDCYLIFNAGFSENCGYGTAINNTKDSFNNTSTEKCELCHGGFMLTSCFKALFSSNCEDCQNIVFCSECVDCSYCVGCSNLRHKKYHIFNEEYSKEEYEKKLAELDLGSYKAKEEVSRRAKDFWKKHPVHFMHERKNEDISGEHIYNSKKVHNSYAIRNGENLKYCHYLDYTASKDCFDYSTWGENARLIYECCSVGDGINTIKFSFSIWPNCRNLEYCLECHSCSDCFACVGLRHKQYCIFNKQYTEQEYKQLVAKIKQHMNEMPFTDKAGNVYKYGEFFPPEFSSTAYNKTMAQDFFPLSREQALEKGLIWYDKPRRQHQATVKASDLPDSINGVDEGVLKEVIECANDSNGTCRGSGVFRMISAEFEFYKKMGVPLPRTCPDCRHHRRIKQRNPMKLHKRQCMCAGKKDMAGVYENKGEHGHGQKQCPNEFETTYAPDREEIVYCKECYQRETE